MISRVGENRFSGIEIEFPALIEYIKKKYKIFLEL
jgi:hypothetical protein